MTVDPTALDPTGTPPEATFDSMNLSQPLRRALAEAGYERPMAVQTAVFEPITSGRDVIVQSKTGSGKTAAFAIPLIDRVVQPEKRVQAMVLCPTRELALQVANEVARLGKHAGIRTTAIYGGASMGKQIDELQAGAQIVAGTPGRVLDHLRRGTLEVKGLRAIVLDEADEMLSMGFAEELNAILEFIPPKAKRQGLLFSATMPESIQRLARRHLNEPEFISLSTDNVAPSDISHYVYFVGSESRTRELARILEVEKPEGAIVFCNTKEETERVASELQRLGQDADFLNGDLEQSSRERVLAALRSGKLKYLVATDVAARGIDISNLSHVINFGFPESAEQYVHRTGRTGRAGRRGTAISLVGPKDVGNVYMLRLTYGIRPIERTLPSSAEERTRREVERLKLLSEAMTEEPGDDAVALSKRLLSHDDAERMIAFLLGEFFHMATREALLLGPKGASAAVPTAHVEPGPVARVPTGERREPRPRDDRGPQDRMPRHEARGPRDMRDAREPRGPRPDRGPRPGVAAPVAPMPPEKPRRIDVHHAPPAEVIVDDDGPEVGMEEVRLAVGRRDGIRAGDVARLVREKAGLQRRDVGRVFVRDRFTLVSVRAELLEKTLAALKDAQIGDTPVAAEKGKGPGLSVPPPPRADAAGEGDVDVPAIPGPKVPRID